MPEALDIRLLDDPDSPITLGSSPMTTEDRPPPSPIYSMGSPSTMDCEEELEDYQLSPEKDKHTRDDDMEEVFIFKDEKKFFESIAESFETRLGNPSVCAPVVNIEQPKQKKISCWMLQAH